MNRAIRRAEQRTKPTNAAAHHARAALLRDKFAGMRVVSRAVDAVNLLPQNKQNEVQLLALISLDAITKGHGTNEHIGALALACNMVCAFIRQGVGEEAALIAEAAQEALMQADRRFTAHQKWGFTGAEYQAVKALLDVHETMVANVSQLEIKRALADIDFRVSRGEVLQRIAE